ncbi:hypothetical protein FB45DRAFT_859938 [Roridomyces roridus]|uniref:T6SS Phospholipase effector Tle1-like catalytic domain-containing protein n=1 Tax=Roridomyces roridus TaxID=1738132 RepID=A0AAD7G327_9AGAR|nr:hypothetical protein FB45DRAFT_859938 [Roridomyces roridus]
MTEIEQQDNGFTGGNYTKYWSNNDTAATAEWNRSGSIQLITWESSRFLIRVEQWRIRSHAVIYSRWPDGCAIVVNFKSNILAGYQWLSENYELGDRIFLLGIPSRWRAICRPDVYVSGYSRRAYQVGLLRTGNRKQIPFALDIYRDEESYVERQTLGTARGLVQFPDSRGLPIVNSLVRFTTIKNYKICCFSREVTPSEKMRLQPGGHRLQEEPAVRPVWKLKIRERELGTCGRRRGLRCSKGA